MRLSIVVSIMNSMDFGISRFFYILYLDPVVIDQAKKHNATPVYCPCILSFSFRVDVELETYYCTKFYENELIINKR